MSNQYTTVRNSNIQRATSEAKKVLVKNKDWMQTREHMYYWIKANCNVSRSTACDYLEDIYARLYNDPEVSKYV